MDYNIWTQSNSTNFYSRGPYGTEKLSVWSHFIAGSASINELVTYNLTIMDHMVLVPEMKNCTKHTFVHSYHCTVHMLSFTLN